MLCERGSGENKKYIYLAGGPTNAGFASRFSLLLLSSSSLTSTHTSMVKQPSVSIRMNADMQWENAFMYLGSHATARTAVYAKQPLSPGITVFEESALSTVLLPTEKGRRCDFCLRNPAVQNLKGLKRCTGCAAYWYCDASCK